MERPQRIKRLVEALPGKVAPPRFNGSVRYALRAMPNANGAGLPDKLKIIVRP